MKAKFSDFINFISILNFKKVFNALIIYKSYFISIIFKKNIHWGMPVSASIELTTNCNLQCPECPSGLRKFSRPTGSIDFVNFQKYIDKIKKNIFYLTLYFQGEPFLNKYLFDFINYAKSKNIYIATSTNGHFLIDKNASQIIESGLDRLIISLDGTDQEAYSSYRKNGNFETVIKGIKNIVEYKKNLKSKKPFIILQFLVLKTNENKIDEIKQLAKDLEVDELQIKTAQFYNFENGNPLMPENTKYLRYIKNSEDKFILKNKIKNRCLRMWQSLVITWDGKIVPCCFDKDAAFQMGDLNNSSLKQIWRNKNYNSFRKKILKQRKDIDICCNCSE